jgi:hypothetical protein
VDRACRSACPRSASRPSPRAPGAPSAGRRQALRAADPDAFPHLAQATAGSLLGSREGAFEAGLEALLDGFERTLLADRG